MPIQAQPSAEQLASLTRTWSKQTQRGLLTLTLSLSETGWRTVTIQLDGKEIKGDSQPIAIKPVTIAGVTYRLGIGLVIDGKRSGACVTDAEAEAFFELRDEQERAFRALPTMDNLIKARKRLAEDASYARGAAAEQRDRRFDRDDVSYSMTSKEQESIASAEQALADFDAANPEVLIEIKARTEAAVSRFLAVD